MHRHQLKFTLPTYLLRPTSAFVFVDDAFAAFEVDCFGAGSSSSLDSESEESESEEGVGSFLAGLAYDVSFE